MPKQDTDEVPIERCAPCSFEFDPLEQSMSFKNFKEPPKKTSSVKPPIVTLKPLAHDSQEHQLRTRTDRMGIWASIVCLIHCIGSTALLLLLPNLLPHETNELFHRILFVVVVALAWLAFYPNFKKHRQMSVLVLAMAGTVLLALGSNLLFEIETPLLHTGITMLGSLTMIVAHYKNIKAHQHCCH